MIAAGLRVGDEVFVNLADSLDDVPLRCWRTVTDIQVVTAPDGETGLAVTVVHPSGETQLFRVSADCEVKVR